MVNYSFQENGTNEAPVCTHVLETYVMTIPDTTAIGSTIGTLDCTDPDHGNVTYQIAITDNIQNIQSLDKSEFPLKKCPIISTKINIFPKNMYWVRS